MLRFQSILLFGALCILNCFTQENKPPIRVLNVKYNFTFTIYDSIARITKGIGEPYKTDTIPKNDLDFITERAVWPGLSIYSDGKMVLRIIISSKEYRVNGVKIGDSLDCAYSTFKKVLDENYKNSSVSFSLGENTGLYLEVTYKENKIIQFDIASGL